MENLTKRQKRHLQRWMLTAGLLCGLLAMFVFSQISSLGMADGAFWFQVLVAAVGGSYVLGFLPAILIEYRKSAEEAEEEGGQNGSL